MTTTKFAETRTGDRLHLAAIESKTLCGKDVRYSVADKRYSVADKRNDGLPMCPKCEKANR